MVFNEIPDLKILLLDHSRALRSMLRSTSDQNMLETFRLKNVSPLPEIARRTNCFVTNVRAIDRVLPRRLA